MTTPEQAPPRYFLGHTEEELRRLELQGGFLRAPTKSLLYRAGLQPGMRVLDYGSGVGDVAFLAAEIVGPTGAVVGFDRSAEAVELASARALAKGLTNVSFRVSDEQGLAAVIGEARFDALVGRLVLVHQPDVVATVRHLATFVRPGGVVAFHEMDIEAGFWQTDSNPLLEQLWRWIDGLTKRGVFPLDIGRKIHAAFDEVGVTDRIIIREGRLVRHNDQAANQWLLGFARTITLPIQKLGLAREDDAPVDVLFQRLMADPQAAAAFNVPATMVGATGTVTHAPAST